MCGKNGSKPFTFPNPVKLDNKHSNKKANVIITRKKPKKIIKSPFPRHPSLQSMKNIKYFDIYWQTYPLIW